ncbi:hypothetical protein C2E23DRAFT_826379 [Lenzites betulinus]|nr:hypothetical protein C2E23DRAFT_826379 [Lenzites betulinus]
MGSQWTFACYWLTGFTVLNILFITHIFLTLEGIPPVPVVYSYVGDDFPTELPGVRLPAVGLTLAPLTEYFATEADDEWATVFPPHDGFTDLGPHNRTFTISMTHQMHCLDVFRVAFATGSQEYAYHVGHCLSYMRQKILCIADTTLEAAIVGLDESGQLGYGSTGYGSVHRCKDWTELRRYLADRPPLPPNEKL